MIVQKGENMYKGYPICLKDDDGSIVVFRLQLEPIESIRLHEEVLPLAFRKICRALCEEGVLQDPIFIDDHSKVILDGMHRAAALLTLQQGLCKEMFHNKKTGDYEYPRCTDCTAPLHDLEYVLCCAVDYQGTQAVELLKWYRGIDIPLSTVLEDLKTRYSLKKISKKEVDQILKVEAFTVLTDGDSYHALMKAHENTLERYLSLREVEERITESGGHITYCADEEAFERMRKGEFSFLLLTPDITKEDVQTFSRKGFPQKGEVFPPKSTRHRLPARPLKVNIPLRLLEKGDYHLRQEQLKVFLRRKRKLVVTGRLEQYLEKYKILFGEPGELKDLGEHPYLWACEFPREFYEIKFDVDAFTEDIREALLPRGMELSYSALIRETNRLILIISNVTDYKRTEELMYTLAESRFPLYELKNLFGTHEDDSPVWMIPMEDYTPSRAYFEQSERIIRKLLKVHKILKSREGDLFAIVQDVAQNYDEILGTYSSEDLLLLFALHLLGPSSGCKLFEYLHEDLPDHESVFSCLTDLVEKGLILEEGEYRLTDKGTEIIEQALGMVAEVTQKSRSYSKNRFSQFLREIDSNVTHVIKPDGQEVDFHIGSIMESLLFTDMGWRKVSDVLDRVADEFEKVDFVSTDELTNLVQDYLDETYPLSNIPFRYDYFINSRDYIFLRDEKVISLSRNFIEEDLVRLIPSFLRITNRQKSQLSNMIYEGIRLLTIPLIKERCENERIVIPKELFSQVEAFTVYQALPLVQEFMGSDKKDMRKILQELVCHAMAHIQLARELLERSDREFLTYYMMAMDELTQSISVGLGWVPHFDLAGRLGQLVSLVKEPGAQIHSIPVDDPEKFFRHLDSTFRRATALLDQWRSLFRKYHGIHFLGQYKRAWQHHIDDIGSLIQTLHDTLLQ